MNKIIAAFMALISCLCSLLSFDCLRKEEPNLPPTILPESIQLDELIPGQGLFALFPFTPTKRYIYYGLPHHVMELAPDQGEAFVDILENDKGNPQEPQVMVMIDFVKHYGITKTEFEQAAKKHYQSNKNIGLDSGNEQYEIPNTDIIYSFDNEVINAYYRRKAPVVPDWLTDDTAHKPVYESYSAFKAVNP